MKSARFVCPLLLFVVATVLAQPNPVPLISQVPSGAKITSGVEP
jgi:hypothetical protein